MPPLHPIGNHTHSGTCEVLWIFAPQVAIPIGRAGNVYHGNKLLVHGASA